MIVFQLMRMSVEPVRNGHSLCLDVDLVHVAAKEIDMANHLPDRIDDVSQIEIAGRDFVQHWRKQEEIFPINDRHLKSRIPPSFEFERGIKSAESAAENEH